MWIIVHLIVMKICHDHDSGGFTIVVVGVCPTRQRERVGMTTRKGPGIWITITGENGTFSEWYVPEGRERVFWKAMERMSDDDKVRQV